MAPVIYLTDTRYGQRAWQHPSARHRCFHYADALLAAGDSAVVASMEHITQELLQSYDHVVFHRPVWNKRFEHAVKCCNDASVQIHADYDDLIFHRDFAQYSPLYVSGNRAIDKVERQFENTFKAARCFDSFLVSTAFLDEKLRGIFPRAKISVLPNSLPLYFLPPVMRKNSDESKTIGYFPGSRGHAKDLRTIIPALKEIISDDVRLLIVGRVNKGDYADFENVMHLPFAGYRDYLQLLAQVDVSIAPLVDNVFNQSKSAVKLIESVSVGTPVVASTNQDMQDHANELASLVSDTDGWFNALSGVLANSITSENKGTLVEELTERFSVRARMPLLQEHLQCVA